MKNFILLLLPLIITQYSLGNVSSYKLDEAQLESSFEQSEDVSNYVSNSACAAYYYKSQATKNKKSQATAALIAFTYTLTTSLILATTFSCINPCLGPTGLMVCLPFFLIPVIPWHRFYLGTGGSNVKVGGLYFLTLSWFLGLPLIDGIFLLLDKTQTKYIDNPNYIMWLDQFK